MSSTEIRIWNMDDCEWWIGAGTAKDMAEAFREAYGDSECEPMPLSNEALDTLKFTDSDENERPIGDVRTFRQQLAIEIEMGGLFPRMFATTEY